MSAKSFCYELSSLTRDPCSLRKDTREADLKSWLCPECRSVKPNMGIVDLHLQKRPKNIVMNFAYGSGFGIIRCDFLDILGKEAVKRDLMLGAVFDARGESIPEFASFRGRVRVAIRGDVTSTCRRCKVCGCYRYSAFGKRYVLAGALCNASIWESQDQSLIVGEE
jgi:hypothetical protein